MATPNLSTVRVGCFCWRVFDSVFVFLFFPKEKQITNRKYHQQKNNQPLQRNTWLFSVAAHRIYYNGAIGSIITISSVHTKMSDMQGLSVLAQWSAANSGHFARISAHPTKTWRGLLRQVSRGRFIGKHYYVVILLRRVGTLPRFTILQKEKTKPNKTNQNLTKNAKLAWAAGKKTGKTHQNPPKPAKNCQNQPKTAKTCKNTPKPYPQKTTDYDII